MCKTYDLQLPRRYRWKARKDYLVFAKSRKHSKKQVRTATRKRFSYVRRNIEYLEDYFSRGYMPKDIPFILTIFRLYKQQEYMYRNKVHIVPNRIISINQPWIHPLVCGKVKAPVEFEVKLDVSINGKRHERLEKVSFNAYNESGCLIGAVKCYKSRTRKYL